MAYDALRCSCVFQFQLTILYIFFQKLETEIEEIEASYRVGSVIFVTDPLKLALMTEAKHWKMCYAKALNQKCALEMDEILDFFDNVSKKLARPVIDLDDIRAQMASLADIRAAEVRIDMTIGPIEESYTVLNKYNILFNDGNAERVDSLTYGWKKISDQVQFNSISFDRSILIKFPFDSRCHFYNNSI